MLKLPALLNQAAGWFSSQVAVEDHVGRTLTFRHVDQRANQLANAIAHHTSANGARIALLIPNRLEFVEADIAIAKSGRAKVPMNTNLTAPEREHVLRDSGASMLIVDEAECGFLEEVDDRLPDLEHVVTIGPPESSDSPYEQLLAAGSTRSPAIDVDNEEPSQILYTSGTTGKPKGAALSYRGRLAATQRMLTDELDVESGDAMAHLAPLSHGSGSKILAYFLRGARNVTFPRFDPEEYLQAIDERRLTATFVVPTMIRMLVDARSGKEFDGASLKTVTYGGAPITRDLLLEALGAFGPVFVQVYGSCEAPHPVTLLRRNDHLIARDERPEALASAGREAFGVDVSLLDDESKPVEDGDIGELCIGRDVAMIGYWNNPEATAAAITNGYYRSGDLARRDEQGYVHIVDRKRDVIISGGLNIYPTEVEAALAEHPAVAQVGVTSVRDDHWGESVVALVVRCPGQELDSGSLLDSARQRLAGYKKPRAIRFVDELPTGSTGKVLRAELRELWERTSAAGDR